MVALFSFQPLWGMDSNCSKCGSVPSQPIKEKGSSNLSRVICWPRFVEWRKTCIANNGHPNPRRLQALATSINFAKCMQLF